jgi:hypothetical protein
VQIHPLGLCIIHNLITGISFLTPLFVKTFNEWLTGTSVFSYTLTPFTLIKPNDISFSAYLLEHTDC